jgi:hypothetical protein
MITKNGNRGSQIEKLIGQIIGFGIAMLSVSLLGLIIATPLMAVTVLGIQLGTVFGAVAIAALALGVFSALAAVLLMIVTALFFPIRGSGSSY